MPKKEKTQKLPEIEWGDRCDLVAAEAIVAQMLADSPLRKMNGPELFETINTLARVMRSSGTVPTAADWACACLNLDGMAKHRTAARKVLADLGYNSYLDELKRTAEAAANLAEEEPAATPHPDTDEVVGEEAASG